jgi:sulfate adenylyltransferase subunit 1 (EFTu-like GTPase family)
MKIPMRPILGSVSLTASLVAGRMLYDAYTAENERLVQVEMDKLLVENESESVALRSVVVDAKQSAQRQPIKN